MRLPHPDSSSVLLVGAGRYASEDLADIPAVANNLRDLAAALTDRTYGAVRPENCRILADPRSGRDISQALRSLATRPQDTLVVYYAGHGLAGNASDELFLALPDTDPDDLAFTAMRFHDLRELFVSSGRIQATNRIVILDCCFSGRAIPTMSTTQVTGMVDIEGVYVLTATASNHKALAPAGHRHTAFTGAILDLLQHGIPDGPELLSLRLLYERVRGRMTAQAMPRPEQLNYRTAGDLALTRNPAFRPTARTPDAPAAPSEPAPPAHPTAGTDLSADGLIWLVWAGAGRGFVPPADPVRHAALYHHYRRAAEGLLDAERVPDGVGGTLDYPLWTLRRVVVDDLGPRWCFVERGRGQPFGPAGGCRFGFAPITEHPGDVWRAGAAAALTPVAAVPGTAMPYAAILRRLLAALGADRARVRLPGHAIDNLWLITAALTVLPAPLAARWAWSTCLFGPADAFVAGAPELSGREPVAEIAAPRLPEFGDVYLAELTGPQRRAFDRLAHNAERAMYPAGPGEDFLRLVRRSTAEGLPEFLDEMAARLPMSAPVVVRPVAKAEPEAGELPHYATRRTRRPRDPDPAAAARPVEPRRRPADDPPPVSERPQAPAGRNVEKPAQSYLRLAGCLASAALGVAVWGYASTTLFSSQWPSVWLAVITLGAVLAVIAAYTPRQPPRRAEAEAEVAVVFGGPTAFGYFTEWIHHTSLTHYSTAFMYLCALLAFLTVCVASAPIVRGVDRLRRPAGQAADRQDARG